MGMESNPACQPLSALISGSPQQAHQPSSSNISIHSLAAGLVHVCTPFHNWSLYSCHGIYTLNTAVISSHWLFHLRPSQGRLARPHA